MNNKNYDPLMTRHIIEKKIFSEDPFSLVDVGASGGIGQEWDVFGDDLQAIGFEPLLHECERLNSENKSNIKYLPYFITSGNEENPYTFSEDSFFKRSSTYYSWELLKLDYIKENFNSGKQPIYTEKKISLDNFFSKNPINIDFIKIDTDGYDYQVLQGGQNILNNPNLLGIFIECRFHGDPNYNSNTFRNIDLLLAKKSFVLFDLSVYRFTRKNLPGKFLYSIPAQTEKGQIRWGDALYLKDYAQEKTDPALTIINLLKLACIHEIFGLYDCAAELLQMHRSNLDSLNINIDYCLDLLTKETGLFSTYKDHMQKFGSNRASFFPNEQIKN